MTKYYNRTNTCYRCRKDLLSDPNPHREYNKEGNWTGNWLCHNCFHIEYNKEYNKRPDSHSNIIKSMRKRRVGNLKDPRLIFADNCEELTCRWRGVKNLNIENNNYCSQIDHSRDPALGIIQSQGRLYNSIYDRWGFAWKYYHFRGTEFDHAIFYCFSNEGKIIERIYIFPKNELVKRNSIAIVKSPMNSRGTSCIITWYEKYRIKDEKLLAYVNELWKEILEIKK